MTDPDRFPPPGGSDRRPPASGAGSDLEAFFAAARAQPMRPSAALTGRVLADAAAAAPRRRRGGGRLGDLVAAWHMPAGLAAALAVGVWVGAMPPAPLLSLEAALFGPSLAQDFADPVDWLDAD